MSASDAPHSQSNEVRDCAAVAAPAAAESCAALGRCLPAVAEPAGKVVSAGEDEMRSMNQSSTLMSADSILMAAGMLVGMMGEGMARLLALVARDGESEPPAAGPLSTPVKECQRSPPVRSGE